MFTILLLIASASAACVNCLNPLSVSGSLDFARSQVCDNTIERLVMMRVAISSSNNPFQLIVQGTTDGTSPSPTSQNMVPVSLQQPVMAIQIVGLGHNTSQNHMEATIICTSCNLIYDVQWACLSKLTPSWIPGSWSDDCYSLAAGCYNNRSLTCVSGDGSVTNSAYCTGSVPSILSACTCNVWNTFAWSTCLNCSQSRYVGCYDSSGQQVDDSLCPIATKPVSSQPCLWNCPTHWYVGFWSACTSCIQTRLVECLDELGNIKSSSSCAGSIPESMRPCSTGCPSSFHCACSCGKTYEVANCFECTSLCNSQCGSTDGSCLSYATENHNNGVNTYVIVGCAIGGGLMAFICCAYWIRRFRAEQKKVNSEVGYVNLTDA